MRHANERIYVGAETKELVLGLGRVHDTTFAKDCVNVDLAVTRRKRGDYQTVNWTAYAVTPKGDAHFELPDDFLIHAEKGLYDAKLMMGDCELCELEIVKAPSIYIKCADTNDSPCLKTAWVEPTCENEEVEECGCNCGGSKEINCSCINPPGGSCAGCAPIKLIARANINPAYSGIPV